MDKNILKSFAINSRKELLEKIKVKAQQYGIKEDSIEKPEIIGSDSIVINGQPLSREENIQREKLIERIEYINDKEEDGYNAVIEEVAYTWFNRFTALRFMEVNNYLPTRVRVLSSSIEGSIEPDIVREANNVNLPVDKKKIYEMRLDNNIEGLFKYMVIAQCNALNEVLPFMFEEIGHYTELLFPDGLLNVDSFVRNLTNTDIIKEEDWKEVEIIGWFYQYYNSEEKDRVIKAKKKYTKEEIPYATQLFTPNWIVRYMVQNSLGRYWIESHKEHSELKQEWEFYLENPNPEPDLEEKLAPYINKELSVEDIKCFDPACGSGHILVYMFDLLYQIYEKCGYTSREIPRLIIEKNLYGLDIDDRAYQLSCFAVIMQGMKYNNRLLRSIEREGININIASIQETNSLNVEDIAYIAGKTSGEDYKKTKEFIEQFKDAKIYGSLIKVKEFDREFFNKRAKFIIDNPAGDLIEDESRKKVVVLLPELIKQVEIMKGTYDVLVTNPPYMKKDYMNIELSKFININYENTKSDLFSSFMEYCFLKTIPYGHLGFMTPYVWMFIGSYEYLRDMILTQKTINNLIQLEYSGFEGAKVPICTFTIRNYKTNINGEYIKLSKFKGAENQTIKVLEAIENPKVKYRYNVNSDLFYKIKGSPIAYWISDKLRSIFNTCDSLDRITKLGQGLKTGYNERFVRTWFEVDVRNIKFDCRGREESKESEHKWYPYANGGKFRKWHGNLIDVVNWQKDGYEIRNFYDEKGKLRSRLQNMDKYFKQGITWSSVTSNKLSLRYVPDGLIYGGAGYGVYSEEKLINYILGLLNSIVPERCIDILSETMNFEVGNLSRIPVVIDNTNVIDSIVKDNISISKMDMDSFELSWEFKSNPLIKIKLEDTKISNVFKNWEQVCENKIYELKKNEERLNEIFLEMYGLEEEISSVIDIKEITLEVNKYYRYKKKSSRKKEGIEESYSEKELNEFFLLDTLKEFISYAVGCMFGRYSLDEEGLIYAGGEFNSSKYTVFKADEDNIIPILSDSYFEDDIVTKFIEFVRVTFGTENLSENLNFIAETLGKKGNEADRDTIRRYFVNDFFKDHCQIYKNRPIYWLFTSGKQKAFNCLIYMHRYDESTLSTIRTDYLHELQDRLDTERKSLIDVIEDDYETKERNDAKKKLIIIDRQIKELNEYDEVLHHMADKQIEIDLDDGVVVNYTKFNGLVSKIK